MHGVPFYHTLKYFMEKIIIKWDVHCAICAYINHNIKDKKKNYNVTYLKT